MLCCVCWIVCVGWSALKCKMCLVVDQDCFCIGFCIDFAMGSLGCCDSAISLLDWLQSCFAQFLRVQWELDMSHWNALPCLLNYTCKQTHNWHRLKILIGKPGLDGHSNGAEQIAVRARDCGMEIVYDGIRFEPKELAEKSSSSLNFDFFRCWHLKTNSASGNGDQATTTNKSKQKHCVKN